MKLLQNPRSERQFGAQLQVLDFLFVVPLLIVLRHLLVRMPHQRLDVFLREFLMLIQPSTQSTDLVEGRAFAGRQLLISFRVVPGLLREVELAAGSGRFVIEESERSSLRLGKRSLRHKRVQFDQAKCVTARGNSMLPALRDGRRECR